MKDFGIFKDEYLLYIINVLESLYQHSIVYN